MIYVGLIIVALAAAVGVMLLAYSKEGLKFRKEQGANDYVTGFMLAVMIFFWGYDIYTLIIGTAKSPAYSWVFVVGGPILLIIWALYTRVKTKQLMTAPHKNKSNEGRRLK